ncbi:MAG: hypothetical protein J6K31_14615, partial [Parabacteroides sp.]|nr:hypothetical protein [Parabacteroides sp.]
LGNWETTAKTSPARKRETISFRYRKAGNPDIVKKLNFRRIACSKRKFSPPPNISKENSPFSAMRRDFIAVTTVFMAPEVRLQAQ